MRNVGKTIKKFVALAFTLTLVACGSTPQPTVTMDKNVFANKDLKVGVVFVAPAEKATTHIYGAACLLCYGVASSLTSSLDKHLERAIDDSELQNMKTLVLSEFKELAPNAKMVELFRPIDKLKSFKSSPGYAKTDFRSVKDEQDIDVLVVFQVYAHGAYRSFSNYIPNGDPQGYVSGLLFAVDLDTNAYVQYLELDTRIQPVGEWDEGPNYPGVTTSYYQAVENTKDKIRTAI